LNSSEPRLYFAVHPGLVCFGLPTTPPGFRSRITRRSPAHPLQFEHIEKIFLDAHPAKYVSSPRINPGRSDSMFAGVKSMKYRHSSRKRRGSNLICRFALANQDFVNHWDNRNDQASSYFTYSNYFYILLY
jgi:hypothetical protein